MNNATITQKEIRITVTEELPTVNDDGDIEYGVEQNVLQKHTVTSRAAAVTYMKLWLAQYAEEQPGKLFYAHAVEYEYDALDREWYTCAHASHYCNDNSQWNWYKY